MPLAVDQLQRSVEHIQFEADRLLFCREAEKGLGQTTFDVAGHDVRAALRETILLHSRVLLAFLFRPLVKRPHGDDLFASLFFESADAWPPEMPAWLPSDYERLHKLLAHLTVERVTIFEQGGRGWQIDRLANLALAQWNHFVAVVPQRWKRRFKPVPVLPSGVFPGPDQALHLPKTR